MVVLGLEASPPAGQGLENFQAADGISNPEPSSSCLPGHIPHCKRSKSGRAIPKIKNRFRGDQITEEHPSQLHLTAHPCGGPRRKRKSKQVAEESNDSEQASPLSLRSRGQPKRRVNCNNTITQQEEKLDSNTLECYLENIWRTFSEEKRNEFVYFDCLWYSLYTKESCKEKVLSWIKKKNIFSKKYVFIPIVQWCHWSLLILCHFGEDVRSKTRTPCMLLLDSLQMANPKRLEPGIRKFVWDICKAEERPENKKLINKIPLLVPKVPQQRNGKECGKFVLYYMNLFLERAPENFSISEGYPYFMKEDWFTPEGLECFYKRLESFRECL